MGFDEEARHRASPEGAAARETKDEEVIRCRRCGHGLARACDRIEVEGRHSHVFVNPQAMEFRISCFARADGCAAWGEAETFWSWFRGCSWRVAVCGRCDAHVGWSFERNEGTFFGLIQDRVD